MEKLELSYLACETAYEAAYEYQKPPGPNRSFLDMKRQARCCSHRDRSCELAVAGGKRNVPARRGRLQEVTTLP